jgi:Ribbon-helix-helix protein, copG family
MRQRMNVYLPPDLLKQIADLADRKKLPRSAIVEAAVASFLSPDGADRREAAFARRLDRLSRQGQRLERNLGIAIETLALFVRFWLTITPPLPPDAQGAAQLKGRQRYEGFVEALGQRLQKGQSLLHEIPEDVDNRSRLTTNRPESEPLDQPGGPGSGEG